MFGLAEHDNAGAGLGIEKAFHRRKRGRLILSNKLPASIAGREKLNDGSNQPRDHSHLQKQATQFLVLAREHVIRRQRTP